MYYVYVPIIIPLVIVHYSFSEAAGRAAREGGPRGQRLRPPGLHLITCVCIYIYIYIYVYTYTHICVIYIYILHSFKYMMLCNVCLVKLVLQ